MVLYICVKFHENINGFQATEPTRVPVYDRNRCLQCSVGHNFKEGKPELWFMCSAHCFMALYISVKFLENISNGLVTE